MTPTEFTTLANDWPSVSGLAADLGVYRQTVYLYLAGKRAVPEPTARLLRILHKHPELRT